MATYKPELDKAMEPVDTNKKGSTADRASKLSESLQRRYGGGPVVTASPFSSRIAHSQAATADIKRRQQLAPAMYEQTAKQEEAGANIQDSLADAYSKFKLSTDELMEKQRQSDVGLDLFKEQAGSDIENKMRELEFSAFRSKAEREDALAKAYADGSLNEELTNAAINNDIKMTDVDAYWKFQLNDLEQMWKDFEADARGNFEKFKADMDAKAAIWGAIIGGSAKVGGTLVEKSMENTDA